VSQRSSSNTPTCTERRVPSPGGDGTATSGPGLRHSGVDLVEHQWWAPKLAAAEASNRTQQADRDEVIVQLSDHAELAVQVLRAGTAVDPDAIADAEASDSGRRPNGMQQLAAGVDRVRNRNQVLVKLAAGDRIEQLALGLVGALLAVGPEPGWGFEVLASHRLNDAVSGGLIDDAALDACCGSDGIRSGFLTGPG
jgi:hypothetical protein